MTITNHTRRLIRTTFKRMTCRRFDRLQARADLAKRIEASRTHDDTVYVVVDSTDCDHYQVTEIHELPAQTMAVASFIERQYEQAEGPTACWIATPEEAASFESTARDHAAEAMGV